MWLNPSFSQVSSNCSTPCVTYRRRDELIRCWNSCAITEVVTLSTKPVRRMLPFTVPAGSGASR